MFLDRGKVFAYIDQHFPEHVQKLQELVRQPASGSAPFYLFNREPVNLPVVVGGLGHGGLSHSPNEYIVIDEGGPTGGLRTMEKSYIAMLDNFSKMT